MSSSLVSDIKTASNKTDRSGMRRTGGTSNSFGVNTELFDSGEIDDFKHDEGLVRPASVRRQTELVEGEFDGDFRRLIEEAEDELAPIGKIDIRNLIMTDRELDQELCLLVCLDALEHDLCDCDHAEHEFCEICCMKIEPGTIAVVESDHQGGQVVIQLSDEAACSEKLEFITPGQLNWLRGRYTQGKEAVLHGRN